MKIKGFFDKVGKSVKTGVDKGIADYKAYKAAEPERKKKEIEDLKLEKKRLLLEREREKLRTSVQKLKSSRETDPFGGSSMFGGGSGFQIGMPRGSLGMASTKGHKSKKKAGLLG